MHLLKLISCPAHLLVGSKQSGKLFVAGLEIGAQGAQHLGPHDFFPLVQRPELLFRHTSDHATSFMRARCVNSTIISAIEDLCNHESVKESRSESRPQPPNIWRHVNKTNKEQTSEVENWKGSKLRKVATSSITADAPSSRRAKSTTCLSVFPNAKQIHNKLAWNLRFKSPSHRMISSSR